MKDIDTKNITDVEVIDEPITKVDNEAEVEGIKFAKWEIKMIFNTAISSVKVSDVSKEDKINLIKLKIELGKIDTQIKEYEKTVVESLKTDEYNAAEQSAQSGTEEDKTKFKDMQLKLEKDASEICMTLYNEEVSIECKHLSEETFYQIADLFDIQMLGGYDYLYNKLVKK